MITNKTLKKIAAAHFIKIIDEHNHVGHFIDFLMTKSNKEINLLTIKDMLISTKDMYLNFILENLFPNAQEHDKKVFNYFLKSRNITYPFTMYSCYYISMFILKALEMDISCWEDIYTLLTWIFFEGWGDSKKRNFCTINKDDISDAYFENMAEQSYIKIPTLNETKKRVLDFLKGLKFDRIPILIFEDNKVWLSFGNHVQYVVQSLLVLNDYGKYFEQIFFEEAKGLLGERIIYSKDSIAYRKNKSDEDVDSIFELENCLFIIENKARRDFIFPSKRNYKKVSEHFMENEYKAVKQLEKHLNNKKIFLTEQQLYKPIIPIVLTFNRNKNNCKKINKSMIFSPKVVFMDYEHFWMAALIEKVDFFMNAILRFNMINPDVSDIFDWIIIILDKDWRAKFDTHIKRSFCSEKYLEENNILGKVDLREVVLSNRYLENVLSEFNELSEEEILFTNSELNIINKIRNMISKEKIKKNFYFYKNKGFFQELYLTNAIDGVIFPSGLIYKFG